MEAYLKSIKEKTGKTWQDFKVLADERGLSKHSELIAWLKADYALGHGHANLIAQLIRQADQPKTTKDDRVAAHFAGAKAGWQEPFDELVAHVKGFGDDVEIAPVKSYINLQRAGKKFGIVQVSGKRIDIGIKNKGVPFDDRFTDSSAWNPMVTHRVQIDDAAQIDDDVLRRLRAAYDGA